MATDVYGGFSMFDVHIEACYDACFDCPFDECTASRAQSLQCPRRRRELEILRATGAIPPGYLTADEVADVLNVSIRFGRDKVREMGLPSEVLRVGNMRMRLYAVDDAANIGEGSR